MRLSIRTRMVLAMNLLVIGVGVAVGTIGIEVAGRAIERRLIDEAVANAAALASEMRLPLRSNALMVRLGQILDAEVASGPADSGDLVASSLGEEATVQLSRAVRQSPPPRRLTVESTEYRLGVAPVPPPTLGADALPPTGPMRLYLLVPEAQVTAAKRQAALSIALLTLAAIVAATAVAFWISTTISRPVGQLAERMDRLAESRPDAGPGDGHGIEGPEPGRAEPEYARLPGPAELVRLERSFDRLLERLDRAREQLARSERLATLGQLAASVAHELRNPLSGIRMNARVLADELDRAGIADRSIELIIREIERMDLFLGELLSLPSEPSGDPLAPQGAPPAGPVRLDELAESVLSLVAGRCAHSGVRIERAFDGSAPPVRGDAAQLRQVVLNLVLNALDAMPHGGRMTLSVSPAPAGADLDGAVRLAVADTGPGVRVPEGADIFEPFVTTKSGGTGLGLAVSRRIITRHGGRIGYDTGPAGSTFWFDLPPA